MRYVLLLLMMMAGGAKKHVPEGLPEVDSKSYGKFAVTNEVGADRVSYATRNKMRVPAIVYHPAGETIMRRPALIVVSPPGEDKSSWQAVWAGILYARGGAVVLTYDPLGEYERDRERRSGMTWDIGTLPSDAWPRVRESQLTDIYQAVRYLADRTDVDGKNIAVLGDEQACTLDSEIRMCVAGVLLSKQTALLLNEKLKFPNWTKKQIQGMPETLKQGITALGKDIPELPRDQLHAVPEAVWKSQVDRYAY